MQRFACMDKIHAKSPCCGAEVIRFGKRRRRCQRCRKTWRIRRKRRGRKRIRRSAALIERVFRSAYTLTGYKGKLPIGILRSRFRKTLLWFLKRQSNRDIPPGPLILIVDGLWFRLKGVRWVLYLRALKPVSDTAAYFMDPILLPGRELSGRWHMVIADIPGDIKKRIIAMVSDGFRSSRRIADSHGWILQRCHFHLIAQLQVNRGKWKLRGREDSLLRESIYHDVRMTLTERNPRRLQVIVKRLRATSNMPACPHRLAMIVREFLRTIDFFRSYLRYPQLNLPTTTNVVESMNNLLRKKVRMLPTPASLRLWAIAMIRTIKKLKCNGHIINQIK